MCTKTKSFQPIVRCTTILETTPLTKTMSQLTYILPWLTSFLFLRFFKSKVESELSGKYRSRRRIGSLLLQKQLLLLLLLLSNIVRTNEASMEFRKWKCFSLVQDPVLQLESMAMEKLILGFVERKRVQGGFALFFVL